MEEQGGSEYEGEMEERVGYRKRHVIGASDG